MPFIAVPGVAEAKISGTINAVPWNVIVHFLGNTTPGSWTTAQLQAIGNSMMTSMAPNWTTQFGTTVIWNSVTAVDLSTSTPAVGISTHAPLAGTSATNQDGAASVMINYNIAARYRGGHGRSYFPGFTAGNQTDPSHWLAAPFNAFVTNWANAIQAANTGAIGAGQPSCVQCIVKYSYIYTDVPGKHKYTKERTTPVNAYPVLGVLGTNKIRTQRRRLGR